MTKGKKWTIRLLGVAALALLICLCLLGSTMARYTSRGDGSGTLTVAVWDLETTDVTLTTTQSVSPSDLPYYDKDTGDPQERTNQSAYIEAFTLNNNSDVDAAVTIELDTSKGITVGYKDGFTWDGGLSSNQANDYGLEIIGKMGFTASSEAAEFKAIIDGFGLFDIALAYETTEDSNFTGVDSTGATVKVVPMEGENTSFSIESKDKENFYAEVLWTSIYETDDEDLLKLVPEAYYGEAEVTDTIDWESFSDDVDTILGLYGSTITFNVIWTAVQDSTLP